MTSPNIFRVNEGNCKNDQHAKTIFRHWTTRNSVIMILFLAIILFDTLPSSEACYIKNCPLGMGKRLQKGKRFDDGETMVKEIKLCPRCGPDGRGQCIGPYTCCMANGGGCLLGIGLIETAFCEAEINNPISCMPDPTFSRCTLNGENGICANDGVCCTEDVCAVSSECLPTLTEDKKLMTFLRHL